MCCAHLKHSHGHHHCTGEFDEPVGEIDVDDDGVARPLCAMLNDASSEGGPLEQFENSDIPPVTTTELAAGISSVSTSNPEEGHRLALARQAIGLNMAYLEAMRAGVEPDDSVTTVPQVC